MYFLQIAYWSLVRMIELPHTIRGFDMYSPIHILTHCENQAVVPVPGLICPLPDRIHCHADGKFLLASLSREYS